MSPSRVVLKMEGVSKRFGATQALRGVEFEHAPAKCWR